MCVSACVSVPFFFTGFSSFSCFRFFCVSLLVCEWVSSFAELLHRLLPPSLPLPHPTPASPSLPISARVSVSECFFISFFSSALPIYVQSKKGKRRTDPEVAALVLLCLFSLLLLISIQTYFQGRRRYTLPPSLCFFRCLHFRLPSIVALLRVPVCPCTCVCVSGFLCAAIHQPVPTSVCILSFFSVPTALACLLV